MILDKIIIALCLITISGLGLFGVACLAINSSRISKEEEKENGQ